MECQPKIRLQAARPMEVTRFIANVERMRQILSVEPLLDPLAKLNDLIATPLGVVV